MYSFFCSLIHIIFNSTLVFFLLVILIECSLRIFKVHNPRVRTYCRLIPIIKLPIDTLYYSICGTHFPLNINPFSCKDYFLHFFFPHYSNSSISEIIVDEFSLFNSMILLTIFLTVTVGVIAYRFYQIWAVHRFIKEISHNATVCPRSIDNLELLAQLQKQEVSIWSSSQIFVPFVGFDKRIYFPTRLQHKVSNEEFNAIIAHEFGHIRYRDSTLKLIGYSILSFFWWIPSRFWMKKIEMDQEMSCDHEIFNYHIKKTSLASGIMKTITSKKLEVESCLVCQFSHANNIKFRIISLLNLKEKSFCTYTTSVGVAICSLGALLFWIC